MVQKSFPVINPVATGEIIMKLLKERNLTVRDVQSYFGFEEPQAIYKWQRGQSLPSVDNLYALGYLFEVPIETILIPFESSIDMKKEQKEHNLAALSIFLFLRKTG